MWFEAMSDTRGDNELVADNNASITRVWNEVPISPGSGCGTSVLFAIYSSRSGTNLAFPTLNRLVLCTTSPGGQEESVCTYRHRETFPCYLS